MVIYKPKVKIHGASVSGTVFAAVANKVYASNLQFHDAVNEDAKRASKSPEIKAGYKSDISRSLTELGYGYQIGRKGKWVNSTKSASEIQLSDRKIKENVMPNVKGMTARDAVFLLEDMGYVVDIKGFGKVIYQSVRAGEEIEKGRLIQIT